MKIWMLIIFILASLDSKAQDDSKQDANYKYLRIFMVKDCYYSKKMLIMQVWDTLSHRIKKVNYNQKYTCSFEFISKKERLFFLNLLDQYLNKSTNKTAQNFLDAYHVWNHIYELLQIEKINKNTHHLSILLSPKIPKKFIPHTFSFIKYRNLVEKEGLTSCLAKLEKDTLAKFDMLMQMTTHIYHLPVSQKYNFFEIYFKEAQNTQYVYKEKIEDTTNRFKLLESSIIDDMYNSDMLLGVLAFDTLERSITNKAFAEQPLLHFYYDKFRGPDNKLEKEKIIKKMDEYLAKQSLAESKRIIRALYIWGGIYQYFVLEKFYQFSFLYILLGNLPEKYIPKDSRNIVYYRNNAKKVGLKNQISYLQDENGLTFMMSLEMTNYIYYLPDKEKLRFFEEYYKQAKIYSLGNKK